MARTFILISILLNCGLPISVSQAQLLRGNAASSAREPARVGLLGGLREAREERFRREEQAARAAARAAVAQRNASTNLRANTNLQQPAALANNNIPRRDSTANTAALTPYQRSLETSQADLKNRTANFRGPGGVARNQDNSESANSRISPSNSLSRATPVTPASATALVPEPIGYEGPGVAIRLPKEARAVVNYLVDEVEANSIQPGEQHVLDAKGSYIVRYSRGVTPDGRSFGESRYTITEGSYRFELTATGWELYREPDTEANLAPPNRLGLAESFLNDRQSNEGLAPEPSSQSELRRISPSQSTEKPGLTPTEPFSSETTGNEEVLPAPKPRSILE